MNVLRVPDRGRDGLHNRSLHRSTCRGFKWGCRGFGAKDWHGLEFLIVLSVLEQRNFRQWRVCPT